MPSYDNFPREEGPTEPLAAGSRAIVRGGLDAVRRAGLSMQIKRGEAREPEP